MSQKKRIIILASVLFLVCTVVTSFAFTLQGAHASPARACVDSCGPVATPTPPTPAPVCPATIAYGSSDSLVKTLQKSLNSKENAGLLVDGQFGTHTKQAVYNWQRYHAFPHTPSEWDSIVGPHTWRSLGFC